MSHRLHLTSRGVRMGASACGLLVMVLGAGRAQAESARLQAKVDAKACRAAYQTGQEKEQAGHLVEASQLFVKCSDEACGTSVWQSCVAHNTQIHLTLPSVIPVVLDESGDPRVDVQVKMDGQLITSQLNGCAIPIDPGSHEFSFSTAAGVFASQKLSIAEGERNRMLTASYVAAAPARRSTTVAKE
jgi:hypothetical protein